MFEDRSDAGRRLAALVTAHDHVSDLVVGIAPGGIVVGRAVAETPPHFQAVRQFYERSEAVDDADAIGGLSE